MRLDENRIICDFSSNDLWNFLFDNNTDESLDIWTNGDCDTNTYDCINIQARCNLQEETPIEDFIFFYISCFSLDVFANIDTEFQSLVNSCL